MSFTRTLLRWHRQNPRPLPWPEGKRDPYSIWLSEIIMQQTRIEQGAAYYLKFVAHYPNIHSLANAEIDDVLRHWEGLGYYTRARNLHKAALHVTSNLAGEFPRSYESLLQLPGVGPYSAAAIASFAYGHRHAVVDGNVKRLIARYEGITNSIDDPSTHEQIRLIAEGYMKRADPAEFNQAIMNFGALVCKPKPLCEICPLSKNCAAFQQNMVTELPVRTTKKPNRHRYFHFLFIYNKGALLMKQRLDNDIWKGLYAPPLIERPTSRRPDKSVIDNFIKETGITEAYTITYSSDVYRQVLSHQTINARYHKIILRKTGTQVQNSYKWLSLEELNTVGKPRIVLDMLNDETGS